MPLPLVVPDASVILKWVLPSANETDAHQALQLRGAIVHEKVRTLVPPLWIYEVGNTVARRFPDHAKQWLAALLKFGLEEVTFGERHAATALELVARHGCTFYDASYHAVALNHGGLFVTADLQYSTRAAIEGGVVPLSQWSLVSSTRKK